LTARVAGRIAGWYALSRLAVLFLAQAALWMHSRVPVYDALTRWDASWYGTIAVHGYPSVLRPGHQNAWAFFPMWPWIIHAAHFVVGGSWQRNGLALAFVLGFTAALCLWLVVADVFDATIADRVVVLFLFMPSAFALSMVYTESLFVTVCALCLYALRRKWWLVAGLTAAVGSATRAPGIVLFACCLVAAATELWSIRDGRHGRLRKRGRAIVAPLTAPLLAPLGLLVFVAVQWHQVGSPIEFVRAERAWNNEPRWGRTVIDSAWHLAFSPRRWSTPGPIVLTILVAAYVAGYVCMYLERRRVPLTWWVFSLGLTAIAIFPTFVGPRYFLPVFPPIACLVARMPQRWFAVVVGISAVLMCVTALSAFGAGGLLLAP
jgi:hypothetical protein